MKLLIFATALVALASGMKSNKTMKHTARDMFNMFDTNLDGMFSMEEHHKAYDMADTNKDGNISAKEYVEAGMKMGDSRESILYMFFIEDKNEDKLIDKTEGAMLFNYADMNEDKSLSFMEYEKLMMMIMGMMKRVSYAVSKIKPKILQSDANNDGALNGTELWDAVKSSDVDGDKAISMKEFINYHVNETGASVEEATRLFKIFDIDQDGKFGSDREKQAIYGAFDYNGDGRLTTTEYMDSMIFLMAKVDKAMYKDWKKEEKMKFQKVDKNGDDYVSKDEYDAMHAKIDANGDGLVNATEYVTAAMGKNMSARVALFMFFKTDSNEDRVIDKAESADKFKLMDMNGDGKLSLHEHYGVAQMVHSLSEKITKGAKKLQAMLDTADANNDNDLSGDEMWNVVKPADMNGDNMLDMKEFVHYWTKKTGASAEHSAGLFAIFDHDRDGHFGKEEEKKAVYTAFDYNKSGMVSKDEFMNAMTFLGARIMRNMMKMTMKMDMTSAMFMTQDYNEDKMISRAEHHGLFDWIDTDDDGNITIPEYMAYASKHGVSSKAALFVFFMEDLDHNNMLNKYEADKKFNHTDIDMNGSLSFVEYAMTSKMIQDIIKKVDAGVAMLHKMAIAADLDRDMKLDGDELWHIYSSADTNGDKLIDRNEFIKFWMKKTGANADKSGRLFDKFDVTKTGKFGTKEQLKGAFDTFDYNKDGFVSIDEYINVMLYIGAEIKMDVMKDMKKGFRTAFNVLDLNKDGKLDMSEHDAADARTDTNNNGVIDATEYVMDAMKYNTSKLTALFMFFKTDSNENNKLEKSESQAPFKHSDLNMDGSLSFNEFAAAAVMVQSLMKKFDKGSKKLEAMVEIADANKDGNLTGTEMWNVISGADTNGLGLISLKEFVPFWMAKTGAGKEISIHIFNTLDADKDGKFGTDQDKKGTYSNFDYDKNGVVSTDEFMNAMTWIVAKAVREIETEMRSEMAEMMKSHMQKFNIEASFKMADNNTDGFISDAEFKNIYVNMDVNKDDKINASEFISDFMKTGMSQKGSLYLFFRMDANEDRNIDSAERDATFKAFDHNNDNKVSLDEYKKEMEESLKRLKTAEATGKRLEVMFEGSDANKDHKLSGDEMKSIALAADSDKDGVVSEAEFLKAWMASTGEPTNRSKLLFGYLDQDKNGMFGNGKEYDNAFDGFDYNDDNFVDEDEFLNSFLFLYAKMIGELEKAKAAPIGGIVGF